MIHLQLASYRNCSDECGTQVVYIIFALDYYGDCNFFLLNI